MLTVAPLAGAWIEIVLPARQWQNHQVAPLAGAWIEILVAKSSKHTTSSLPSRERGLKYVLNVQGVPEQDVAPLAGAWIEIPDRSQS